jgi:hypothetical protein
MPKIPRILFHLRIFTLVLISGGLSVSGCGDNRRSDGLTLPISASSTACASGTAEILVGDGFMQNLCGCTGTGESADSAFFFPRPLTCHLAPGKTSEGTIVVMFKFFGTFSWHQIVSVGPPNFGSTPLFDPANPSSLRAFGIVLTPSSHYSFKDVISGMTGDIYVP